MNNLISRGYNRSAVSRYRHVASFLLLAVLWGVSFPAIDAGLDFLPPVLFAASRYSSGGALLLLYVALVYDDWLPTTRNDLYGVFAGGAFLIGGNALVFLGQQHTTSGVAAVVFSLVPILTTAFAWLLLPHGSYSATSIAGVLLGLVGVVIVANPSPSGMMGSGAFGTFLVFLAAVIVALGSVLVNRAKPTLLPAPLTSWAMLFGGLLLHAASFGVGESPANAVISPTAIVSVLYLGVFASAVAYMVYFYMLHEFGPLEINLVSYLVPVFAAIGGWVLIDQRITSTAVVGFGVIFAGFVVLKHRHFAEELPWFEVSG
jgi:drug/metabolite transporter (DMT)-like permease